MVGLKQNDDDDNISIFNYNNHHPNITLTSTTTCPVCVYHVFFTHLIYLKKRKKNIDQTCIQEIYRNISTNKKDGCYFYL